MKVTIRTIEAIAAMNASGFTISANDLSAIECGYAVSIAETQNSFGTEGIARVLQAIEAGKANAIGGWYDSQSGLYYYDAVCVYSDKQSAEYAAIENDQIAYFDLNNCKEIRLKESSILQTA